jgi:hypothetical protein
MNLTELLKNWNQKTSQQALQKVHHVQYGYTHTPNTKLTIYH